jgi:hypothetical protein
MLVTEFGSSDICGNWISLRNLGAPGVWSVDPRFVNYPFKNTRRACCPSGY